MRSLWAIIFGLRLTQPIRDRSFSGMIDLSDVSHDVVNLSPAAPVVINTTMLQSEPEFDRPCRQSRITRLLLVCWLFAVHNVPGSCRCH